MVECPISTRIRIQTASDFREKLVCCTSRWPEDYLIPAGLDHNQMIVTVRQLIAAKQPLFASFRSW